MSEGNASSCKCTGWIISLDHRHLSFFSFAGPKPSSSSSSGRCLQFNRVQSSCLSECLHVFSLFCSFSYTNSLLACTFEKHWSARGVKAGSTNGWPGNESTSGGLCRKAELLSSFSLSLPPSASPASNCVLNSMSTLPLTEFAEI